MKVILYIILSLAVISLIYLLIKRLRKSKTSNSKLVEDASIGKEQILAAQIGMNLICKYSEKKGSTNTYLLIPNGTFKDGGQWSAIYLEQATLCPTNLQEVMYMFSKKENYACSRCWFVFFGSGWSDAIDFAATSKKITSMVNLDKAIIGNFAWVEDSSASVYKPTQKLSFNISTEKDTQGNQVIHPTLIKPESSPLYPVISSGTKFVGDPCLYSPRDEGQEGRSIWFNTEIPTSDHLYFSAGYAISLFMRIPAGDRWTPLINAVNPGDWKSFAQVLFQGDQAGSLVVQGNGTDLITTFNPEFIYSLSAISESNGMKSSQFSYPIFSQDDWKAWIKIEGVKCSFSPGRAVDPSVNFITIQTNATPIKSFFQTELGNPVYLQSPTNEVTLAFNRRLDGKMYLTLEGEYKMTVSVEKSSKLRCGLSGTESISFEQGDLIKFVGGQPAGVEVMQDTSLQKPADASFVLSEKTTYTTSRVWILPGNATQPSTRLYYSEPGRAPFFKEDSASSTPNELSYYPYSKSQLPDTFDSSKKGMTMVPYAGMIQNPDPNDFGHSPGYVEEFENKLLNPIRHMAVSEMKNKYASTSNDTVYALTPQGYQATFEKGIWTEIELAQAQVTGEQKGKEVTVSQVKIHFSITGSETALPDAIQEAFLTNQQFLVMTANTGGNLDGFSASIMMSEWSFGTKTKDGPQLQLPTTTVPGEYSNVIICKSCNSTISQLVKQPRLWTQYEEFNDVASDPTGTFLSNWLEQYIEEAKTLYDNGNGVESLADFCNLIDNPNWNGFLILKAVVGDLATLPVDVQVLVADIKGGLYAHHLGNEINHVKLPASGKGPYDLNSPFFGLIHYVNPDFAGEIQNPPTYVQNPADFDFTVLSLEVVFEKVLETHFSNKSMLVMNKILGDQVRQFGPKQIAGANNLILVGTYHEVDNVPSYTFSTAKGSQTDFYLNSNALNANHVSAASMNVVKLSGNSEPTNIYLASFEINGVLELLEDDEFDLLSYSSLPYTGLTMNVTVQHDKPNKYALDSSKLQFINTQTEILQKGTDAPTGKAYNFVRAESLVAQFPMQLKGLVQYVDKYDKNGNPDNASPADIGYRLLETSIPDGISFQNPSKGAAWYGLEFEVILGGKGSLASSGAISASIVLAWTPGGDGFADATPQFKLAGPGGVSLGFDFEGVLKFGAKDLMLNRFIDEKGTTPNYFYLIFQSIGLSLLGISFPPGGTTNLMLMGDTSLGPGKPIKPTLGWFGGYAEKPKSKKKQKKPKPKLETMKGGKSNA